MNAERYSNFGFLLSELKRRYVLRFEEHASQISLTLPLCKVLVRLQRNEGVSQARLGELADLEPMAMVRILDRMEADGLLERRTHAQDRRVHCLFLTDKAKPILGEILRLSEITRAETFAGVAAQDQEVFLDVLEALHRNLCAFDEPHAHRPAPGADSSSASQTSTRTTESPRTKTR